MSEIAGFLVAVCVVMPWLGICLTMAMMILSARAGRAASAITEGSVLCSCLAALCLAMVFKDQQSASSTGVWFEISGGVSVEFGWSVDRTKAIWIAVSTGIAWLTMQVSPRRDQLTAVSITTAMVAASTVGLVLSTGLIQLLLCWMAVSLSTLAHVGWCSPGSLSVRGVRRAIIASLPGDILLLWAILAVSLAGRCGSFAELSLPATFGRLAAGNPTLPGVIGCLVILSVLPRCGLFPCFGWHQDADQWDRRSFLVIYGIGFVPASIWVLLKFHPLLTSDVPLGLLGGLGTLGAMLAAFTACGQANFRRRVAFLLAAQAGIAMATLGSGHREAVHLCAWHQCAAMIATFVLMIAPTSGPRPVRIFQLCAALSLAGVLPLAGGVLQQNFVELNARPIVWSPVRPEADNPDSPVDALTPVNSPAELVAAALPPRWMWICGMWITQLLTAFAIARSLTQPAELPAHMAGNATSPLAIWSAGLGATMLLLTATTARLAGEIVRPASPDSLIRLIIGQACPLMGLLAGFWTGRVGTSTSHDDSFVRLAREGLYVNYAWQSLLAWSTAFADRVAGRWMSANAVDQAWAWLTVRVSALMGTQIESLQISEAGFYVAAVLLSTATLLLTLILVA